MSHDCISSDVLMLRRCHDYRNFPPRYQDFLMISLDKGAIASRLVYSALWQTEIPMGWKIHVLALAIYRFCQCTQLGNSYGTEEAANKTKQLVNIEAGISKHCSFLA
ncbi:unnamed protein product [Protopolystoma xenopodis]|uniref:Uncharacterized protein n=1 Tax=Protopolystoma xenopodis TaxID=117903 RepID=A0A3S5CFN8_9PLAT|nr:unnamed protein product [Protopolystoma xenopodis]